MRKIVANPMRKVIASKDEIGSSAFDLDFSKPEQTIYLKFSKEKNRFELWLDFTQIDKFPYPYRSETKNFELDRTRRHFNFFEYENYLNARVPRVRCGQCNVRQVEVIWAPSSRDFILLFEALKLSLGREMSVAALAEATFKNPNRPWRILKQYAELGSTTVDLSAFHQLGIDEFLLSKSHVYMIVFIDLEASKVIFLAEGWRKGVIEDFFIDIRLLNIDPTQIEMLCCGMRDPNLNGIGKVLKYSLAVFEWVRAMSQISQALKIVPRREQQKNTYSKMSRFLWPKNVNRRLIFTLYAH
jgi:transposase